MGGRNPSHFISNLLLPYFFINRNRTRNMIKYCLLFIECSMNFQVISGEGSFFLSLTLILFLRPPSMAQEEGPGVVHHAIKIRIQVREKPCTFWYVELAENRKLCRSIKIKRKILIEKERQARRPPHNTRATYGSKKFKKVVSTLGVVTPCEFWRRAL